MCLFCIDYVFVGLGLAFAFEQVLIKKVEGN